MPELVSIDDPSDPRIAPFRDIRERDLVRRHGFIAEGAVVVEQLLAATRFRAVSLLILQNRLAGLGAILEKVPHATPVYVADRGVMDEIAGFAMHRGVLGFGEAHPSTTADDEECLSHIARKGGAVVVGVGIANHDNIGAIFRNAAAFGVGAVVLDETSCHPLYRKAIRVSAGAALRIPFTIASTGEGARRMLAHHGFRCLALSPAGAIDADDLATVGATALFLGAEGPGLAPELMAEMETVRIAMAPGVDSLNVATAGAIVLQKLFSARGSGKVSV